MKEIEVLVQITSDKKQAMEALAHFNFVGTKHVLDVYLVDPLRAALQPEPSGKLHNSLRVRLKDGQASTAYKVDHVDESQQWTHSDEYETDVKDFSTALAIYQLLGLVELVRVENIKHAFTTELYEVVIEEVSGLGLFLEVEWLGETEALTVAQIKSRIREFITQLNIDVSAELDAGKPELLLRQKLAVNK